MPQLQEGDEIVHINGRTVKDLPHQEVFFFFFGTCLQGGNLFYSLSSFSSIFSGVSHSQHPN